MLWFKKKQEARIEEVEKVVAPPIEVVAHKNATKREVAAVKVANEKLNKVFERNHFTVKLYVAAGHAAPKTATK